MQAAGPSNYERHETFTEEIILDNSLWAECYYSSTLSSECRIMSEDSIPDGALLAADEILDALAQLGITDGQVVSILTSNDDPSNTPKDAVASYADRLYRATGELSDEERTSIIRNIVAQSNKSITTDHTYHHKKNLEPLLNDRLNDFGWGFEFQSIGDNGWIEPDSTHPRAIKLVVTSAGTEEHHAATFRYPPNETARMASNQFMALATALNDTVFREIGVRLLYLPLGDDSYNWLLLSEADLSELQAKHGTNLSFSGEPLILRSPRYEYSWKQVAESPTLHHMEAFGVPEPDDVYKIEDNYDLQNPTTQLLW